MPRRKRPLDRSTGALHDADLIIVASEDTYAAKHYFDRFKTRRSQFHVIPSEDGLSSPAHVLKRLNDFHKEFVTEADDTFWLCIDRDRWPEETLTAVLRECIQKGYGVALSNPCFELWLLLHHEDWSSESHHTCDQIKSLIRKKLGECGPQCFRTMQITKEMIEDAIQRAKKTDGGDPSNKAPFTQVYKILEVMLEKDRIISFE